MKTLEDKTNLLTWIQYDENNAEETILLKAHNKLKAWSPRIADGGNYSDPHNYLSNLYIDNYSDNGNMFFCYEYSDFTENNILVGMAIITPPYKQGMNASIDYIVVDPNKHSRSIGTRMVSSITHNPEFFVEQSNISRFEAVVNTDNLSAQLIFIKNKYIALNKSSIYDIPSQDTDRTTHSSITTDTPTLLKFVRNQDDEFIK